MNCPTQRKRVDLELPQGISFIIMCFDFASTIPLIRTVLTLNTPTTLSHSVPLFGCHSSSFERALARLSTRSRTSRAECSVPVSPQVNGGLELVNG